MKFDKLCEFVLVNEMARLKGGPNHIVNPDGSLSPRIYYANGRVNGRGAEPNVAKNNMYNILTTLSDEKFIKPLRKRLQKEISKVDVEDIKKILNRVEDELSTTGINYDDLLDMVTREVGNVFEDQLDKGRGFEKVLKKSDTIAKAIIGNLKDHSIIVGEYMPDSTAKKDDQKAKKAADTAEKKIEKNIEKKIEDADDTPLTPEELAATEHDNDTDEYLASIMDIEGPELDELEEVEPMSDEDLEKFEKELARSKKHLRDYEYEDDEDEILTTADVKRYGGRSRGFEYSDDDESQWY